MDKLRYLFFLLQFCHCAINGQTKSFYYDVGSASVTWIFDTTMISEERVKNSCYLGERVYFDVEGIGFPENPTQYRNMNISKFKRQVKMKRREIKKLKIAKGLYWEELRNESLTMLEQISKNWIIFFKSFNNPTILLEFPGNDTCENVTALIAGGDVLLERWKKYVEMSCSGTPDPDHCIKIMNLDKINTDDKYLYARMCLIPGGICYIEKVGDIRPVKRNQFFTEFRKLFLTNN